MAGYDYIVETGVIVPDTETTKTDVQSEYLTAFGSGLVLDDATPQGRLIDVEVLARDTFVRTMAEFANQINPNVAVGVFLEAICGLHGIEPPIPSYSVVTGAVVTGTHGTVIPETSRVSTSNGDVFRFLSTVTIDVSGTALVDLRADEIGHVEAAAGSITQIMDGVLGWIAITNPNVAVPGIDGVTDSEMRTDRNALLSVMGKGTSEAIQSNVMAVPDVHSVQHRENMSASTAVIDGVTLTAHATWVAVQGGADAEIGMALFKSKQSGSPWTSGVANGTSVLVNVVDPNSGQNYVVAFNRGDPIPILVRVTVSVGFSVGDPTILVPNAILAYAAGDIPGESGFVLGADVSPFELAGAIYATAPGLIVRKVEVCKASSGVFSMNEIPLELWEFATVSSGNISTIVV